MLTLDDINKLPNDPSEDHLRALGLLPQPAPAPSIIPPAGGAIPKPSPVTSAKPMTADWRTKLAATAPHVAEPLPPLSPVSAAPNVFGAPESTPPIAPTEGPESPLAGHDFPKLAPLNFKERQALPTTSEGVAPGSKESFEAQLERQQDRDRNPYGSAENHPGLLGKIGHYAAKIGNIAGDVIAPATMANIPGTDANRMLEERGLEKKIAAAGKEEEAVKTGESERDLRAAETKKYLAATPQEKPENLAQLHADAVQDAIDRDVDPSNDPKVLQIEDSMQRIQKTTAVRPESIDQAAIEAKKKEINPATGKNWTDYEARIELAADIAGNKEGKTPPHVTVMKGGKPHIMERDPNSGEYTVDRGEAPPNYAMVAPVLQQRSFTQQEKMFDLRQQALTAATKSMIEAAPTVTHLADRIDPLIDKLHEELGPGAGRWSEFWTGKVGANNPEYQKLRTDVGLMRTALMRMHVGAKGGVEMMTHFRELIDEGKHDPDNMKAALAEIRQYAYELEQKGIAGGMNPSVIGTGGGAAGGAVKPPPQKGDVVKGHIFNGGDPADKKNWKKQ